MIKRSKTTAFYKSLAIRTASYFRLPSYHSISALAIGNLDFALSSIIYKSYRKIYLLSIFQ